MSPSRPIASSPRLLRTNVTESLQRVEQRMAPSGASSRSCVALAGRESLMGLGEPVARALGDSLVERPLLDGAVVESLATDLGFSLQVRYEEQLYVIEVAPKDAGIESVTATERFVIGYRAAPPASKRSGQSLCLALRDRLLAVEATIEATTEESGRRVRDIEGGRILALSGSRERPFYAIHPYIGCLVGCRFCYAQTRVSAWRRLHGLAEAPWGSYVDVRSDAANALRAELEERPRLAVKFTPIASDPYHAIERERGITRACLEVLAAADPAVATIVLTRSELVLRDLDILERMPRVWVGVSLPTIDDEVRRHFEPRAASVEQRIAVLKACRQRGIASFAMIQPMLPGDPDRLVSAVLECADSASLDVLHGTYGAAREFASAPWSDVAEPAWQQQRMERLITGLRAAGLPLWAGELPPGA